MSETSGLAAAGRLWRRAGRPSPRAGPGNRFKSSGNPVHHRKDANIDLGLGKSGRCRCRFRVRSSVLVTLGLNGVFHKVTLFRGHRGKLGKPMQVLNEKLNWLQPVCMMGVISKAPRSCARCLSTHAEERCCAPRIKRQLKLTAVFQ